MKPVRKSSQPCLTMNGSKPETGDGTGKLPIAGILGKWQAGVKPAKDRPLEGKTPVTSPRGHGPRENGLVQFPACRARVGFGLPAPGRAGTIGPDVCCIMGS